MPCPETNEKPSWVTFRPWVARASNSAVGRRSTLLRHAVFHRAPRGMRRPTDCQWEGENEGCPLQNVPASTPARWFRAPEVVGRVLNTRAQIENEFVQRGRSGKRSPSKLDGKRSAAKQPEQKSIFPRSGHTKRNLSGLLLPRSGISFLPFLRGPGFGSATLFPTGIKGQAFFQKRFAGKAVPGVVSKPCRLIRKKKKKKGTPIQYATANDRAFPSLFEPASAAIDHNPWSNRYDDFRASRLLLLRPRPFPTARSSPWSSPSPERCTKKLGGIAPGRTL